MNKSRRRLTKRSKLHNNRRAQTRRRPKLNWRVAGELMPIEKKPQSETRFYAVTDSWPPRLEDGCYNPHEPMLVIPQRGRDVLVVDHIHCQRCDDQMGLWWTSDRLWKKLPKALRGDVLCVRCFGKLVPDPSRVRSTGFDQRTERHRVQEQKRAMINALAQSFTEQIAGLIGTLQAQKMTDSILRDSTRHRHTKS